MTPIETLLASAPWLAERAVPVDIPKACLRSIVLAATNHHDKPVGVLRALTDGQTTTYLCDLFVTRTCRKQGWGRMLMERLLAHPEVKGTSIVLLTQPENEMFYRKFGFEARSAMVRRPDAPKG